jgi:hypothetical protein
MDKSLETAVDEIDKVIDGVNTKVAAVKNTADAATNELDVIGKPIKIEIQSRGACVGNRVDYWIDGKQGSSKGNRGIHVITLKQDLSAVEKYDVYDTHGSATHVNNMIKYLRTVAAGRVVLFALKDEGISRMNDDLKYEIGRFGSKFMTMGHVGYRESWAMIGIKGTPPGYAVEEDGGDRNSGSCYGTKPTGKLVQEFPRGKIQWLLNDARQKLGNLPSQAAYRKSLRTNYANRGNGWTNGRSFSFYKYSDSTVLKISWNDNFRCYSWRYGYSRGSHCQWEIYIDNQRCRRDGYESTDDAYNRLHAEGNTHRTNTLTYFCHQLNNGEYVKAGKHTIGVYTRNVDSNGEAYIGWPSSPASIEMMEIF